MPCFVGTFPVFEGAVPASQSNFKVSWISKIVPFGENDEIYSSLLGFLVHQHACCIAMAKSDFVVFWIEK